MNEETKEYLDRMNYCRLMDEEYGHQEADDILCELVQKYVPGGSEIVRVFNELGKWYA